MGTPSFFLKEANPSGKGLQRFWKRIASSSPGLKKWRHFIDFQYLPGELNLDADAMSRPAAAEPEPVVYALLPGDLPTDRKDQDLAAAQQLDQEILQLVERLKGD